MLEDGPVAVADGRPATPAAVDSAGLVAEAEVSAAAEQARAGNSMRTKEFLGKLEHDQIVRAIREAESKTAGKIHVFFQRGKLNGDPVSAAQKRFHRLGLHKNTQRNDVLIFVAPRAHKFAIV